MHIIGMGKEVENLILENNELLATKFVFTKIILFMFLVNTGKFYRLFMILGML